MIPTLNMNKIYRSTVVSGGGGGGSGNSGSGRAGPINSASSRARPPTGRQSSPHTSYATSPREVSGLASAHLTRRAAEVAPILEMNPLQCHHVGELQRKLVETGEWVAKLRLWYMHQLQERDIWYESRLRGLGESFQSHLAVVGASTDAAPLFTTGIDSVESFVPSAAPSSKAAAAVASVVYTPVTPPALSPTETEASRSGMEHQRNRSQHGSPAGADDVDVKLPNGRTTARPHETAGSTDVAASGGGCPTGQGDGSPLPLAPPRRSAVSRVAQVRRTASAGVSRQHTQRADDYDAQRIEGTLTTASLHGGSRSARTTRSAVVAKSLFKGGEDYAALRKPNLSSSAPSNGPSRSLGPSVALNMLGVRRDARTPTSAPLGGRSGKAEHAIFYFPSSSGSVGGVRHKNGLLSESQRYYTTSPRVGSGGAAVVGAQHARYVDVGAGNAAPFATSDPDYGTSPSSLFLKVTPRCGARGSSNGGGYHLSRPPAVHGARSKGSPKKGTVPEQRQRKASVESTISESGVSSPAT